jgi:hypothetical protein
VRADATHQSGTGDEVEDGNKAALRTLYDYRCRAFHECRKGRGAELLTHEDTLKPLCTACKLG